MQDILPYLFLILTVILFFLNILALMQLFSMYITMPLLLIFLYLTIYSFTYKKVYRGNYFKKRG